MTTAVSAAVAMIARCAARQLPPDQAAPREKWIHLRPNLLLYTGHGVPLPMLCIKEDGAVLSIREDETWA